MHTLNPFVCGTFHNNEYDDEPCLASPGSSPRKHSKKRDSRINNPYSTRGLDKFSSLLEDLDEKRKRIYSQMNPHDISFVRFVYSNTDDFVPVVVKVKNNKDQKKHINKIQELGVVKATRILAHTSESTDKSSTTIDQPSSTTEEKKQSKMESDKRVTKKSISWNVVMKKHDMGKPCFYLPLVMVLILLLLTVFGRSVSTLCICVLWYLISTLKDSSSLNANPRKSMKKKDYVRGLSEKKIVTNNEGNSNNKKKDYVRGWSEKKMVVSEGIKKKDYARGWSEKKIATEGLLSPKSGDSEASKHKISRQHSQ
ncbi:hypothetical protein RJT34_08495 [Clitoria ternatea]|uniref:ZCF37 n=1 Tax=Clitoria ternatea TaxID=43366 RepID=A0AAN9K5S7_CLITE